MKFMDLYNIIDKEMDTRECFKSFDVTTVDDLYFILRQNVLDCTESSKADDVAVNFSKIISLFDFLDRPYFFVKVYYDDSFRDRIDSIKVLSEKDMDKFAKKFKDFIKNERGLHNEKR